MAGADDDRALIARYITAYNAFDIPGLLATLHPEVTFRNLTDGQLTATADGLDEFRALAERSAAYFASRRQTLRRFERDGTEARIEVDYEAVLKQDLGPGMKTGDTLKLSGRSRFGFRDGLIAMIVDES